MVRIFALIPVAIASETCSDNVKASDDVMLQVRAVGAIEKLSVSHSAGEDADCPCIALSDLDASDSPGYPLYNEVDYPAAVGTSCKAWDKKADPSCGDKSDGWCVDSWCYVDPCTCKTGTPVKSSYFPKLKTVSGDPAYYSYATCGVGTDDFTCTSDDPTNRACTCNTDEVACGAGSNCVWDKGACIGSELAGGCVAASAESADCPCIDLTDLVSSKVTNYPHFGDVDYPAAVGTSCKAWDKSADPSCGDKSDGWCVDSWCYVDPCTCKKQASKSSYFPSLETSSGDPAYYSYATCGDTDAFTCQDADPTNRACTCNADEAACGSADKCAWNDGKCVGEELVNGCTAEVAEDADCPCIDLSQIDASDSPGYPLYNSVDYPGVVGTTCKAWDKSSDPSCDSATDGWCVDAWCYVDPCTCKTGNAKKSSYFPELKTITGEPLYYSYATCGVGADDFTCTSSDPTQRACTCNADETSCGSASGCAWDGGACVGEELAGGCLAEKAANPDCPCIALTNIDSSNEDAYPHYNNVDYPAAVGTSCRAWDSKADPGCGEKSDGWCVDAWCYVDPCSCKTGNAKKSSYFPALDTMHGQPVYYSYATCGVGTDDWTCSAGDPTKRACTCNANEATCGGVSGCSWTGNRCVGSELLGC